MHVLAVPFPFARALSRTVPNGELYDMGRMIYRADKCTERCCSLFYTIYTLLSLCRLPAKCHCSFGTSTKCDSSRCRNMKQHERSFNRMTLAITILSRDTLTSPVRFGLVIGCQVVLPSSRATISPKRIASTLVLCLALLTYFAHITFM